MSRSHFRVLCLGGYMQNAESLKKRLLIPIEVLNESADFEFDFVDPPYLIPSRELLSFKLGPTEADEDRKWKYIVERGLNRCWWESSADKKYDGFEQSFYYIVNYIRKNGPYDGILGFSQGASMSSIVTNYLVSVLPSSSFFSFGIYISGFAFSEAIDPSEDRDVLDRSIESLSEYNSKVKVIDNFKKFFSAPRSQQFKTKLFFIYGLHDYICPYIRTRFLASFFDPKFVHELSHDGTHVIPKDKKIWENIATHILCHRSDEKL